jgi:sugar/nucleoside kinase (ribokinase family)
MLGPAVPGPLDRSEVYVAPSGNRIVFNSHALSGAARYAVPASAAAGHASAVVIASPTPLVEADRILAAASPAALKVALLHSRQVREAAAGRTALLSMVDVVCVSEGDAPALRSCYPAGFDGVVVTTRGAEGASIWLSESDTVVDIAQPDVVATRNTNGAGEAFCGALVANVLRYGRGLDAAGSVRRMREAVLDGHRYAAAHLRAGGNLGFPDWTARSLSLVDRPSAAGARA